MTTQTTPTGCFFIHLWTIDLNAAPHIVNVGGIIQYWPSERAVQNEVDWYRSQPGILRAEYAPEE